MALLMGLGQRQRQAAWFDCCQVDHTLVRLASLFKVIFHETGRIFSNWPKIFRTGRKYSSTGRKIVCQPNSSKKIEIYSVVHIYHRPKMLNCSQCYSLNAKLSLNWPKIF